MEVGGVERERPVFVQTQAQETERPDMLLMSAG